MAQPTPYALVYDFVGWQISNPTRPLPANKLETEFQSIEDVFDQVLANLALIQRDDGQLKNKSVGYDQLADELTAGVREPVVWTAGATFLARDTVFIGSKLYRAVAGHVSASLFATDLAAGKWEELTDLATGAGAITSFNARIGAVVPEVGDYAAFYQPLDSDLTALAGLTSAADKLPYFTGSATASVADFTAFARTILDDADAATVRTTLGLVIGTNVQAYDAELAALAGLTSAADKGIQFTGAGTAGTFDLTAFAKTLLDDADAATARATLGLTLGSAAQAWDADLDALAALASTGFAARTTTNTWAQRSLAAPAAGFTITNPAGIAGNPTFALSDDLAALEALSGTNTIYYRSAANTWTAVTIGGLLSFSGGTLNVGDAELAALAGLTSAADRLPYFTGAGTAALATFTAFGRSLVDDADATAARTTLGVVPGTDVQAFDAFLDDIAALTDPGADRLLFWDDSAGEITWLTLGANLSITGATLNASGGGGGGLSDGDYGDIVVSSSGAAINIDSGVLTTFGRSLIDDADAATARTTLGLGTMAVATASDYLTVAAAASGYQPLDADLTTWAGLTPSANAQSLVTAANYAAMRALLDLEAGTDFYSISAANAAFQPLDSDLTAIAALTTTAYGRALLALADEAALKAAINLEIGVDVQAYDAELAALAGLTSAADKGIQFTGAGAAATYDLSAFAKTFLDDADAAAVRTTLGLVIGTNVQAYDAELAALAGLTSAADKGIQFTGAGTAATYDLSTFAKTFLDDVDAAAVRTTLGLVIGTNVQAYDADLATIAGLSAPGADRILFWDDSAGAFAYLTLGTNLSISGTTLNASGGGGSGLSDGDYGDITVSGSGTAISIDNDAVTYAKMQNVAANSVLARAAGTSGDLSEVSLSASQLLGRGSTGDVAAISLGSGLSMSGTTLDTVGGGGMTLISTLTTTSGTTHSVTSISSSYRSLYIEVEGVSASTFATLRIALSNTNGSAYGTTNNISPNSSDTTERFGTVEIKGLQIPRSTDTGRGIYLRGQVYASGTAAPLDIATTASPDSATAGRIDAIQFSLSAGSFDAGTIRVYGVK